MSSSKRFLVTGAAGFIGSSFVRLLRRQFPDAGLLVVDALTYAGNVANLEGVVADGELCVADIADAPRMKQVFDLFRPTHVVNFAAESHVDRSVTGPSVFITTNVCGTQALLEAARTCDSLEKFVQVSTDEVYGDLPIDFPEGKSADGITVYGRDRFTESNPLKASSPYSASKASADLLALSYHRTFGLPVVVTRCSNNYGPRQFPEKLIPLLINNMLEHRELPVYGRGLNVRDWIYVDDHSRGVLEAAVSGHAGEVYNFGADCEKRNIDIVRGLIELVRDKTGDASVSDSMIRYVADRPGHDLRYAMDSRKTHAELGWKPLVSFGEGLAKTVGWYLENRRWVEDIVSGSYREYYNKMYSNR